MSKQKKTNLISLIAYRRKKQKQVLKKAGKAAGDETDFFSDEEDSKKSAENSPPAKIYYMKNYLESKKLPPAVSKEGAPEDMGKTLEFPIHKTKMRKKPEQKNGPLEKPISLEDYRKRREQEREQEREKNQQSHFMYYSKQAVQVLGMTLMMLFVFSIFFQKENVDRRIVSEDKPIYEDNFLKPDGNKTRFIKGRKPDKNEVNVMRGLSSTFIPETMESERGNREYIKKIQNINPEEQTVIFGKKPNSSEYKGF